MKVLFISIYVFRCFFILFKRVWNLLKREGEKKKPKCLFFCWNQFASFFVLHNNKKKLKIDQITITTTNLKGKKKNFEWIYSFFYSFILFLFLLLLKIRMLKFINLFHQYIDILN